MKILFKTPGTIRIFFSAQKPWSDAKTQWTVESVLVSPSPETQSTWSPRDTRGLTHSKVEFILPPFLLRGMGRHPSQWGAELCLENHPLVDSKDVRMSEWLGHSAGGWKTTESQLQWFCPKTTSPDDISRKPVLVDGAPAHLRVRTLLGPCTLSCFSRFYF